ncbi:hypothetical protein PHMEG_00028231 [Phytophthora megakarya]|uniref:Jacalin-type lectin domain-containing protein n=1 Tax=Phytophthora megakarya TaxID=4795 RepID=A0A225V6G1_9STRA|nr:hypothetical protein PHMEG_00028231 [Phytophthora megakarya]
MNVLHVVLIIVALVSINNGITTAKSALRSDSCYDKKLSDRVESNTPVSVQRVLAPGWYVGTRESGIVASGGETSGGRVFRPADKTPELPPGAYFGAIFGGDHGDAFSDVTMVESGQKVLSINLRANERVDAVILTVVSPTDEVKGSTDLTHGGHGGDLKTPLVLTEGEYITTMEAHSGKHKSRTRIKYIKFTTNKGNFIEGGTKTDEIGTDTAKEGYQLSGFVGRSGDELDMVGAIWTSVERVSA